jgi:hypothetical protein
LTLPVSFPTLIIKNYFALINVIKVFALLSSCDKIWLVLITLGAFDILIYTDKDQDVPEKWEESGPQFIANSQEVRLRSFSTLIHKVNAMVAYKN